MPEIFSFVNVRSIICAVFHLRYVQHFFCSNRKWLLWTSLNFMGKILKGQTQTTTLFKSKLVSICLSTTTFFCFLSSSRCIQEPPVCAAVGPWPTRRDPRHLRGVGQRGIQHARNHRLQDASPLYLHREPRPAGEVGALHRQVSIQGADRQQGGNIFWPWRRRRLMKE